MSAFEKSTLALEPMPPQGSVYFSQAHSLRWIERGIVDPSLLYREILSYALFFEALVISDSYAIFNWQIKEMLPNGLFCKQCPGLDLLIEKGAIRIARRRRASLEEVARDLIRRQGPVMVDGVLTKAGEDFLPHAENLARLTAKYELTFDHKQIKLADSILEDFLENPGVRRAYEIEEPALLQELVKVVQTLSEGGLMYAAELFNYPDRYPGLLKEHKLLIQKFATSAHSCTFPVTHGLLPVVSPNSDDHLGATAFFEQFAPEVRDLAQNQEEFLAGAIDPDRLLPNAKKLDFTQYGIHRILELRTTTEFRDLQRARARLLNTYRHINEVNLALRNETVARAEIQLHEALAIYLGRVAEKYGVTELVPSGPQAVLQRLLISNSREIEELRQFSSASSKWFVTISALSTALVGLGVLPYSMFFATGALAAIGSWGEHLIYSKLKKSRRLIEAAGRLHNLSKAVELETADKGK